MDGPGHQGELVVSACDLAGEPPIVGVEKIDPDKGGGLEHDAGLDLGVAVLDAPERAARYSRSLGQFFSRQPARVAAEPDELAKECQCFACVPGIGSVFYAGHQLNMIYL